MCALARKSSHLARNAAWLFLQRSSFEAARAAHPTWQRELAAGAGAWQGPPAVV